MLRDLRVPGVAPFSVLPLSNLISPSFPNLRATTLWNVLSFTRSGDRSATGPLPRSYLRQRKVFCDRIGYSPLLNLLNCVIFLHMSKLCRQWPSRSLEKFISLLPKFNMSVFHRKREEISLTIFILTRINKYSVVVKSSEFHFDSQFLVYVMDSNQLKVRPTSKRRHHKVLYYKRKGCKLVVQ